MRATLRHPTRRCNRKLPGFALRNRWGRGLLRRQVYRTCLGTPGDSEQRAREKKQFHSYETIFTLAGVQIREKLIVDQSSLTILEPWTPGLATICDYKKSASRLKEADRLNQSEKLPVSGKRFEHPRPPTVAPDHDSVWY